MSSAPEVDALPNNAVSEADIIDFLQQNPAWLDQQPDLLVDLQLSHDSGSATSLLERQLKTLRLKNRQLEQNLRELIQAARRNEDLSQRLHSLALELMRAEDASAMMSLVQEQLQTQFDTDQVSFRFLPNVAAFTQHPALDQNAKAFAEMQRIAEENQPLCGRFPKDWMQMLFSDAEAMQSAALVPLHYESAALGLLALASENPERFDSRMGTVFLQQLGQMCSHRLIQFEPA